MKKNGKDTQLFNETSVEQAQQQETVTVNNSLEPQEEQPKSHRLRKTVAWLVAAAVVLVPAVLIMQSCHGAKKDKADYSYYYGEEPSDGHISYEKGKSNIINPATKEVLVEDIDWCHYASNSDENPIVLFAKDGKRGFCNIMTNKVIVRPDSYTKAWVFSEGLAAVEKKGYIGFIDTTGKLAIDLRFSYRGNDLYEFVFHDGHCIVADSTNKIGVIDTKGRWVIKPRYDHVDLAKDYAIVYNDGDFKKQVDFNGHVLQDGIIDDISELYYEVKYTNLESGEPQVGRAKNNDYYEYKVGSRSGLIDSKGKIITPPIYTNISGITPTLFKARLQDWSSIVIIDTKGNVISNI